MLYSAPFWVVVVLQSSEDGTAVRSLVFQGSLEGASASFSAGGTVVSRTHFVFFLAPFAIDDDDDDDD